MKRVGKKGKANLEANRILKEKFAGTEYCELRLEGCLVNWLLQFAHRHKRIWYKGDVEKLSDKKQVVIACQACHDKIENNRELTEQVFNQLRGNE